MISTKSVSLDLKQVFAVPVLWAITAAMVTFMYPILGVPSLGMFVACLYWAIRAAFFNKRYTYHLGGLLLFGVGAGIVFLLIACIMLSEVFFHVPKTSSYLAVPAGLLYLAACYSIFYFRERRTTWQDFQVTRANRYLSVAGGKVVWLDKGRSATPVLLVLAIGGGIALVTIVGAFFGKEHAQGALVALAVVGLPILTLSYGMRVIIGLTELRKLEKATGTRFPLHDLEEVQQARAGNWIGRLINPELRAIYRTATQNRTTAATRAASHTRK
jgi:hypothetical protein